MNICARIAESLVLVWVLSLLVLSAEAEDGPPPSRTTALTTQPARATTKGVMQEAAGSREPQTIELVEPPTRASQRLKYASNVFVFNLDGDGGFRPFEPSCVWEWHVGEFQRAIVLLDQTTHTALLVVYENPVDGRRVCEIGDNSDDEPAFALLIRGASGGSDEMAAFLSGRRGRSGAFVLTGRLSLTLQDGYVHDMEFEQLVTEAPVPPDEAVLRRHLESRRSRMVRLRDKVRTDPGNELLEWQLEEVVKSVRRIEQRLENPGFCEPAGLTDGRITAKWVAARLKLDIAWP
ncbi:MAG: hypothetical protein A49_13830 [Methyloceanibacter sp.]|nr:MAG: hypothetical protein A49_13830 [Methyloceanibacter sp.]